MTLPRFVRALAAVVLIALPAGCASHDSALTEARPGKYRLLNCTELEARGREVVKRERELADLIRRAGDSPGGQLAASLAYKTEYSITLSDLREVEQAGIEKKCVLKHRSVSDQIVR